MQRNPIHDKLILERLVRAQQSCDAMQASVYLVRTAKPLGGRASSKVRNAHAPARRMARTIIGLGPEEGTIFGLRALRQGSTKLLAKMSDSVDGDMLNGRLSQQGLGTHLCLQEDA